MAEVKGHVSFVFPTVKPFSLREWLFLLFLGNVQLVAEGGEEKMTHLLEKMRVNNPLVHNMTNQVVANDVANGLLAMGASPVMAYAVEEVASIASISKALVLNIGTLTSAGVEAMMVAGIAANKADVPVVLDPVGVGASSYRQEKVREILAAVKVTLIRGNSGEIANLAEVEWQAKGVDAGQGKVSVSEMANKVAQRFNCIVAVSGEVDYITNGRESAEIRNGVSLMAQVTGMGCLLSGICGAFIACANKTEVIEAVITAHAAYGIVGEKAKQQSNGPGSFRVHFMDGLANLTVPQYQQHKKINRWEGVVK